MTKSYLILAFVFVFSLQCFAQKKALNQVSIDAFISETQYSSDNPDNIEMIWWLPTEYWNVVFSQDQTTSKADQDAIISMLKDFVVVVAIKGKVGMFGGITYETKEHIKAIINVSYKKEKLAMVSEDNIEPDMLNFLSIIKPMMKNMIGPMGENMQFFLFQAPKNNELLPIDPYSNNELTFALGDFEKDAELPLSCLLEEKICSEDNKTWNGKYNFCPIHGSELNNKEE